MIAIRSAMQASVGNAIETESVEKNYKDLRVFTFAFMFIVGWTSICMVCLYQPFMRIWMASEPQLCLSDFSMVLFCIYFYAINMNNTRNLYLNGKGLFIYCTKTYFLEAISNLVLNILLGYLFGINGIILATILTIIIFNFIERTEILFKYYFRGSSRQFYGDHIFYALVTLVVALGGLLINHFIVGDGVLLFAFRGLITGIYSLLAMMLIYFKTKQFSEATSLFTYVLKTKFCLKNE